MTVWPHFEVMGTIRFAPKVSPYMTRVLTTFAIVSPFSPFSIACCSGVSNMGNSHPYINYFVTELTILFYSKWAIKSIYI